MYHSGNSRILKILVLTLLPLCSGAYTRQDSLRGSNGRGRDWWDVVKYDLEAMIDTTNKEVWGSNTITFRVIGKPRDSLQIDLQGDMTVSRVGFAREYNWTREGNVFWITQGTSKWEQGKTYTIEIEFAGKPRRAINPPWDGGVIWAKDSMGKPWLSIACQGLGASIWWPCKDYQGDEPDSGMNIAIFLGKHEEDNRLNDLTTITNGRTKQPYWDTVVEQWNGRNQTLVIERPATGVVHNPINTYSTTFYIGDYAHWHDTLRGEKGVLDLDFYPLSYKLPKALKHWTQAKEMLHCFEWWMGPYPFYEDGYKLVEAPYLGMEHQSAIAYGNQYMNGYNGYGSHMDRSGTGIGFSFDYIIIHESGHEWFGNSITARDVADNWLHEGFTSYSETLFAEWIKDKDSAFAYTIGTWDNIRNDRPVIGDYGVNDDGSADRYNKGAAVVHMIRMMMADDSKFRELLRGLNRDFYHRIVTTKEVEDYISKAVGRDLKPFFDQYLRTANIPAVSAAYYERKNIKRKMLTIVAKDVVRGFSMPIFSRDGQYLFTLSDKPVDVPEAVFNRMSRDYLITRTKD